MYSFRIQYQAVPQLLQITFDFSLSSISTVFPKSANFSIVLFKVDNPTWVWRSALEKYATKLFAEPYSTRVVRDQVDLFQYVRVTNKTGYLDAF